MKATRKAGVDPLLLRRPVAARSSRSELGQDKGCIWLASYPKSGNTWLRTFINNLLGISRGKGPVGINTINMGTLWEASVEYFGAVLGKDPTATSIREIAKARPRVQERLAASAHGRVFLKTHLAALKHEGEFAINWGVTRAAVYIIRNPLDVACSYAPHYGISIDDAIKRMGQRDLLIWGKTKVPELVGSWSQNVASWTDQKLKLQPHVMRYEEMISNPHETFGAFVNYVGAGITESQIAEAIELSTFEKLKRQEEEGGFGMRPAVATDAFFRRGKSGQWRDTLTTAQVDRIVSDHALQMQRFGYLP